MVLGVTACTTVPRVLFTAAEEAIAEPAGFPRVRYLLSDPKIALGLGADFQAAQLRRGRASTVLSLSGGGANEVYVTMVRTGEEGPRGISCLVIEKDMPGVSFGDTVTDSPEIGRAHV